MRKGDLARVKAELELRKRAKEKADKFVDTYLNDPPRYFEERLGVKLWQGQLDILEMFLANSQTSVRAGQKVGKSILISGLAMFWAETHPRTTVLFTASTYTQVEHILWREFRAMHMHVFGQYYPYRPAKSPDHGCEFANGAFVFGISTNDPVRAGGYSGKDICLLADEASGIDDGIIAALQGNTAGGGKLLLSGNPTEPTGYFKETFSMPEWANYVLPSTKSPNYIEGRIVVPGLATKEWIDARFKEWEFHPNLINVRILAEFPTMSGDRLFPQDVLSKCYEKWHSARPQGALKFGVDVARMGDDLSCIQAVRGNYAYKPLTYSKAKTDQLADILCVEIKKLRVGNERVEVRVDAACFGGSFVDILRSKLIGQNVIVIECDTNDASKVRTMFGVCSDSRAQAYVQLYEWIANGGAIPKDTFLQQELEMVTYYLDKKNRFAIQSKDIMRKVLKRSPDRLDSLSLAVFSPHAQPCDFVDANIQGVAW